MRDAGRMTRPRRADHHPLQRMETMMKKLAWAAAIAAAAIGTAYAASQDHTGHSSCAAGAPRSSSDCPAAGNGQGPGHGMHGTSGHGMHGSGHAMHGAGHGRDATEGHRTGGHGAMQGHRREAPAEATRSPGN